MADTIRELIIQEFIARAAVIRTTGATQLYATDIGSRVLRARKPVDQDELPCCVVWPQPEEGENKPGQVLHRMPLVIDGAAYFGSLDPSVVIERILGDLVKCFTSPAWDRRRLVTGSSPAIYLSPYAESIIYQGGGPEEYPDAGMTTVGCRARLLVTYWTLAGDPCAL
jgi:hypothetical protein